MVDLKKYIRDILDFPEPGILFRDITPLLRNPQAFNYAIDKLVDRYSQHSFDTVVAVESRGFLFGPPVALSLGSGFAIARKAGKLPWETVTETYDLEYGAEQIEMHRDAVLPGQKVLLVDDLIATGGTAAASARLVQRMGGEVVGASFLIELAFLEGRKCLGDGLVIEAILTF